MINVTLTTLPTVLAVAMRDGVIISALLLASQQVLIYVCQHQVTVELAVYPLDGPLFFVTAVALAELSKLLGNRKMWCRICRHLGNEL